MRVILLITAVVSASPGTEIYAGRWSARYDSSLTATYTHTIDVLLNSIPDERGMGGGQETAWSTGLMAGVRGCGVFTGITQFWKSSKYDKIWLMPKTGWLYTYNDPIGLDDSTHHLYFGLDSGISSFIFGGILGIGYGTDFNDSKAVIFSIGYGF
jgi:hypothetical protein